MAKTRKCPECGSKMSIRKSSKGEGGKFWGCTAYPDCKKTIPYYGDGARAGADVEIRQISNGFIIVASMKYAEDNDEPAEIFCKEDQIAVILAEIWRKQAAVMVDQISDQLTGGFDKDEETENKKAKNAAAGDAAQATGSKKDIKKLLEKAKAKALPEGPCLECGGLTEQNRNHQEGCSFAPPN